MKLASNPLLPGRALALAALLLLAAACRSTTPVPVGSPLPFHVALIPTEVHDTTVLTATPNTPLYPEPTKPADDDMHLDLGTKEVSKALRDELARVFVRATLLELPTDTSFANWSPQDRERHWQEEAHRVGADLLVRTTLLYDPNVSGDHNEKIWLNVPLWLILGGPFSWFVSDRSYEISARMQAEVFDTSVGHESLDQYALLPIPLYAEFKGTDMTLIDRADGVSDYAISIVWPAGLLARETKDVEEELEERLPLELGRELARKVLSERSQFEQNPALGAFKLDDRSATLEPAPEGRVRVRVPVEELPGEKKLLRYEVSAGSTVVGRNFQAGKPGEVQRMIEEEMTLPAGAEYLTVRVVDAGSNTRSYTLKVDTKR